MVIAHARDGRIANPRNWIPSVLYTDPPPAFDAVIALRRPTWKDPAAKEARWRASMQRHALDRLGKLPVGAVATADLLDVLAPLWGSLDEARRLKQRMRLVMQ